MSVYYGTLTQRLVHPQGPVLLIKNGPQGITIRCAALLKQVSHLTHLKIENKVKQCACVRGFFYVPNYIIQKINIP